MVLRKRKTGKKCTKIIDENGKTYEDLEAAEFLKSFYANVGPTLAQKHNKDWEKEKCRIKTDSSFSDPFKAERGVRFDPN